MSTQHPVRPAAKAAPNAVKLALAFLIWIAATVLIAVLAYSNGADARLVAEAAALALAPALAGLILLPWLTETWGAAVMAATWMLTATGLVAGTGGALSPLAALFCVPPVLTLALHRRWAAETGAVAVLAYAAAAALALQAREPVVLLGAYPEMLAVAAIAFAAGLLAVTPMQIAAAAPNEQALARRIAEVAHELRTPLTHILGFSEMIEKQLFGPVSARYVEYAGLIWTSGSQLLELVNDQLDASRIDAGRYQLELDTFDARGIVEEVVRVSVDAAARKAIALSAWLPDTPLLVRADARALRRMLINTVGNAVKFTPEGGRVIVAARGEGERLVLETIDNGPGIPANERALLGQAYERGAGGVSAEGTGLGLSLVSALAALHGGTLSFHDAPGGGALVRIDMPVMEV